MYHSLLYLYIFYFIVKTVSVIPLKIERHLFSTVPWCFESLANRTQQSRYNIFKIRDHVPAVQHVHPYPGLSIAKNYVEYVRISAVSSKSEVQYQHNICLHITMPNENGLIEHNMLAISLKCHTLNQDVRIPAITKEVVSIDLIARIRYHWTKRLMQWRPRTQKSSTSRPQRRWKIYYQ